MYYAIRHLTRFRYPEPIRESLMELFMQPRSEGGQRLNAFAVSTQPRAQLFTYEDHLGNTVHHFNVLKDHAELQIEMHASVEMAEIATLPEALSSDAWDLLRPEMLNAEEYDMLHTQGLAVPCEGISAFLSEHAITRDSDPLTTLRALAWAVHDGFAYDTDATDVDTPLEEVLKIKRGVCQDFSHVMIAGARALGIPARYVSGYLYHRNEIDDRPAPDATHSWVEAFMPGLGWIGIDPTNKTLAGHRHIRVGVGRDYADVPPTRGTFKGRHYSELAYAVSVQPAEAPIRPAAMLKVARKMDHAPVSADERGEAFYQQQQQQQQ
ncbi:MAG: transglutaminase family protein [Alphaproteobacteria bacterium]|nr:transglutaminase family protein [Alphaproteobacteria bacterium]